MKLANLIPVDILTIPLVKMIFKQFGLDVTLIEENIETLDLLISTIKKQEQYKTVADILADEELMKDIMVLFDKGKILKGDAGSSTDHDIISVSRLASIKCPCCGHFFSLASLNSIKN